MTRLSYLEKRAAIKANAPRFPVSPLGREAPYVVDSADFDGATPDYMTRGAGLTGLADGKQGLVSIWLRIDANDTGFMRILMGATTLAGGTARFAVTRLSNNTLQVLGRNAAATDILNISTVGTYTANTSRWLHILSSWDLAVPGASHLYINDVSDKTETTFTDDTINYNLADWGIAAAPNAGNSAYCCLAEFYFTNTYLDLSNSLNRRKFISGTLKPVSLGADGSVPTGTAPLVYNRLAVGETVTNFALNRGTGGDFAITGTLSTGSSSPTT